jgi:hypothetical protein
MPVALRIDGDSLEVSASEAVWGGVWLEIEGHAFPEPKWNDLVLAFVTELLEGLRGAARRQHDKRRVRFFDGPYWVDLQRDATGVVTIGTTDGHSASCDSTEMARLVAEVEDTARRLVELCRQRGWSDLHDVRRLQLLTETS